MTGRCNTCGEYLWSWIKSHKCHPAWRVWSEYDGDNPDHASVVYAHDAQAAVESWAEDVDENWTLIDSAETVKVMSEDDYPRCGEWKTFEVCGEAAVDFHATEKKDGGE